MASFIKIGTRFLNLDLVTDTHVFDVRTFVHKQTGEIEYRGKKEKDPDVQDFERVKDSRAFEVCFISPAPSLIFYGEEAVILIKYIGAISEDAAHGRDRARASS